MTVKQIIEVVHFFSKWIYWNYAQKCCHVFLMTVLGKVHVG